MIVLLKLKDQPAKKYQAQDIRLLTELAGSTQSIQTTDDEITIKDWQRLGDYRKYETKITFSKDIFEFIEWK